MSTATKIYQKGEFIFKQGEYASCMYDICQSVVPAQNRVHFIQGVAVDLKLGLKGFEHILLPKIQPGFTEQKNLQKKIRR